MSNRSADVDLSLATVATEGYTQAKDEDGNTIDYWYLFSGGDDTKGDVTASKKNEELSVTVALKGASNGAYDIEDAEYKSTSDTSSDITFEPVANNKVIITDNATTNDIVIYYNVVVTPKNSSTKIYCDPRITNSW